MWIIRHNRRCYLAAALRVGRALRSLKRWVTRRSEEVRKSQTRIEQDDAKLSNDPLKLEYEDYLRRQRGLSERTIYHCWRFADRFLDHRFGDQGDDLRRVTPGDVVAFLQHVTTRKPPFKAKTPPTHLRNFFQYLFKCGLTSANLAICVPSVAQRYSRRLPRHLAPDQVEAVLTAVRANPKHGRRDYAMMLLMARLGLPAPDLIAIRLHDISSR